MSGSKGVQGAVVRCRGSRPSHHCAAIACVGRLGDVGRSSGNHGVLRVRDCDVLNVSGRVATIVDRDPRPHETGTRCAARLRVRHVRV